MSSISVVIPTFNRAQVLGRALASVFSQTLAPVDVIVVDDGSSDETQALIQRDYPQVRYIFQNNKGVSAARNRGIEAATSEWIALLDSDDEWLPEKLERQIGLLQKCSKEKVCHTEEIWVRNGKRVNQMKKHQKTGGWIYQRCLPMCAMSPSSIVIHRDIFNEVGLFDETLPACEDYDLWLKICARFPVAYLDEPMIVKYGGHEDQLSQRHWGMDRFRIQSLASMLRFGELNQEDRDATLEMLQEKLRVLSLGAIKRDNQDLLSHCESLKMEFFQ